MSVHRLKTWPEYFDAMDQGVKTFEVRQDDRGFQVGDRLILERFDPDAAIQTPAEIEAEITYMLPGGRFGIEPGYVVLGLAFP